MKRFLAFVLYKLVEIVEFIEYRNLSLDEDDIEKKILSTKDISLQVSSDSGMVPATHIHKTQPYQHYKVLLSNGQTLTCADNHILFTTDYQEIFVRDLLPGTLVSTRSGYLPVEKVTKLPYAISMFDLTIDTENHRYYTNDFLSHNTVSAAIYILYFCTFNSDKNIMIAANKRDTVNEIVNKIKDIYYLLPFFIQPSVLNWNQSSIAFGESKCRIKTTAATKSAAVGFTCDLLYMDEMALIPNNIADDLYRSIFPTISAVKNSKIIVTSTPNGYNLFHKLLTGAEKDDNDAEKNDYMPMRVYWHQVPGRFVTYLRINKHALVKHGVNYRKIYDWVLAQGFPEAEFNDPAKPEKKTKDGVELILNHQTQRYEIHIPNKDENLPSWFKKLRSEKEGNDTFMSQYFRTALFTDDDFSIHLRELCEISSWKEDAVKNIGSEEAFNQEYDLQFMAGNRMLFTSQLMNKLENAIYPFEHLHIEDITKASFVPYDNLRWIKDRPDLFSLVNAKDMYITIGVDLAEGMGGDASVINIFRVVLKPVEEWGDIKTLYDLFRLEQIGIFFNNYASVQDVAELLYLLCFEVFDQDKLGVVLESNNWGNEVQKTMIEMYNGRNKYSNHIFFRYKHRMEDAKPSIGIKLRNNKNMYVKMYQNAVKAGDIIVHEESTLKEMTTFIKKDNGLGSVKYEADSGNHDDITMTVVEMSSVFEHVHFQDLVNRFIEEMPETMKKLINDKIGESPYINTVDYTIGRSASTTHSNQMRRSYQANSNNPYGSYSAVSSPFKKQ